MEGTGTHRTALRSWKESSRVTFRAGVIGCCISGKQEMELRESQRFRKKEEEEEERDMPLPWGGSTGKGRPECGRVEELSSEAGVRFLSPLLPRGDLASQLPYW